MNRRFVRTFEWLTLCPHWGPLPQIAQRCAMVLVCLCAPESSRMIGAKSASHSSTRMDSKTKANPQRTGKPPRTLIQPRDLGWSGPLACPWSRSMSMFRASTSAAVAAAAAETSTLTGAPTMPITECDGRLFKEALLGSLAWLTINRDEVDALNVFPVPDGDTGT